MAKAQPSRRDAGGESTMADASPHASRYFVKSFTASWMHGASAPAVTHAVGHKSAALADWAHERASFLCRAHLGLASGAQRLGGRLRMQPICPSASLSAPLPLPAEPAAPPASQRAPCPWPWPEATPPAGQSAPPGSRMRQPPRMRRRTPQPLRTLPLPLRWRCCWQAAAPGTAARPAGRACSLKTLSS